MSNRRMLAGWLAALAAAAALGAANLWLGDLNQDEGWYLYAARLVAAGQRPYVDFASTQGPVMPYVYALAQPLVARWGVAGGRLFTALLGLAAALAAAALAGRLAPPRTRHTAALTAFILIGVNVYQSYFFTVVKTYALAGLFLTLGFLCLSRSLARGSAVAAFFGAVCLTLSAGVRVSAAVVLPVALAVLLARRRRSAAEVAGDCPRPPVRPAQVAAFVAGGALAGALLFVPFALKAPQALWFALVEYHAGRSAGGALKMLAYKCGFFCRLAQAYPVALGLGLIVCVYLWLRRRASGPRDAPPPPPADRPALPLWGLWLSVLAVTAVHVCAPFPYDDYQAMVFPIFAAALAALLARLSCERAAPPGPPLRTLIVAGVFLLSCLSVAGSPMIQNWFAGPRDRIWWPLKKETPLANLRGAARLVRGLPGIRPGDAILTQDLYLAVEAGLGVPAGLELGPFCYFPEWSTEKAAARHVLNRELLTNLLETCAAPVAAFSGYGLAVRAPEIVELPQPEQQALWRMVERRYRACADVDAFGQAGTRLRILVRREPRSD